MIVVVDHLLVLFTIIHAHTQQNEAEIKNLLSSLTFDHISVGVGVPPASQGSDKNSPTLTYTISGGLTLKWGRAGCGSRRGAFKMDDKRVYR